MADPLKAGQAGDFAGSLADYIDRAMQAEWQAVKHEALPSGADDVGVEDRRILFAAVAQGVLAFLRDNRQNLVTTDENGGGLDPHHHAMNFTVSSTRV
ncbi:hypothetical protein CDL60_19515 [Roseateles noduli]|nr:hypothetical protein CDL60_19515 [Roseateles noduli]